MSKTVRMQRGLEAIRPYVPGKPIEEVVREYGITDVIKLASNENPVAPPQRVLQAIADALPHLNLYPDGTCYDLRQALSNRFHVAFDQVGVGNGADNLILQVSMAFLEEGDEVVVSRSSFAMYDLFAHAMRAKLVKTRLAPGYRVDLDAMVDAFTDRTKLVYVCNPNNPTGTIVTAEEFDTFVRRVPESVLIVVDEAYREMVDSDTFPDVLALVREGKSNLLVLRSFSKVYGLAGIRLGYAFGSRDIIAGLSKIRSPFAVNTLAQVAGIAALKEEGFIRQSKETNRAGRDQLCREFDRLGLEYPESHTNFVLVRVGPNAEQVQQELLRRGVIVRPCAAYELPEFLRISVGTPEQNARLITSLEAALSEPPFPNRET